MKLLLAVTACPTGIAHTYMSAQKLQMAAKEAGVKIKIETNGAIGVENKLTTADIEAASAIIIAADVRVDMDRFKGKPLKEFSVSQAIKNADQIIAEALSGQFSKY